MVMAGGDDATFERARPLLEAIYWESVAALNDNEGASN